MGNQNGRNVALPDENRPTWRPQDEYGQRSRRSMSEDDDRYSGHWEDRSERRPWDRDYDWRMAERYGQGQSGYGAGRDDRGFQQRNQGYPGSFEERYRDRGDDDRWSGRGGSSYDQRGYRGDRGFGGNRGGEPETRQNLGTGGGYTSSGYYTGPGMGHRGKGPSSYQRSDERIRDAVCEALTENDWVDATHIDVNVKNGEVTLSGTVDDRQQKRMAEDCAEQISGVRDVQNQLRVGREHKGDDKHRS